MRCIASFPSFWIKTPCFSPRFPASSSATSPPRSSFPGSPKTTVICWVGVNIGGVGTLIASLASLITFREYGKNNPGKIVSYVGKFSAFNFAFLLLLLGFMFVWKMI